MSTASRAASLQVQARSTEGVAQGLQLSGDLTGLDVAGLLRRLGGSGTGERADGVTRIPVDGAGPEGNGTAPR